MSALRLRIGRLGPTPSLKIAQIVLVLAGLAVLARLSVFVVREPFIEGDTTLLVTNHVKAIRACLMSRQFLGCPGSGVWPLLQNVPSILLSSLGLSDAVILHALAYLSFLSFLGSL